MDKIQPCQVLAIGGAIMDLTLMVEEKFLEKVPGKKHGGVPIDDYALFQQIIQESPVPPAFTTGGSAANAIKGLSQLGRNCGIVGRIGKDEVGQYYREMMEGLGVKTFLLHDPSPTAQCLSLVTPDGQRTMRSFLGAALNTTHDDIVTEIFENVKLVHIEGYSLFNQNGAFTRHVMEIAKEKGLTISFDCSSFEVVNRFFPTIRELIENYVDIVFANEEEAFALTGKKPLEACQEMGKTCDHAIVLINKDGCFASEKEWDDKAEGFVTHVNHYPAFPVKPVDSTGAGDYFAAGFLHGFLNELDIPSCAQYGALLGCAIVQCVGAEIPEHMWPKIRELIEEATFEQAAEKITESRL